MARRNLSCAAGYALLLSFVAGCCSMKSSLKRRNIAVLDVTPSLRNLSASLSARACARCLLVRSRRAVLRILCSGISGFLTFRSSLRTSISAPRQSRLRSGLNREHPRQMGTRFPNCILRRRTSLNSIPSVGQVCCNIKWESRRSERYFLRKCNLVRVTVPNCHVKSEAPGF